MSIGYKTKKKIVRYKQKMRIKGQNLAFKQMTIEQTRLYNTAKNIAIKYYTKIRYDKVSGDTIIDVEEENICVVLNNDTIGLYTDSFVKINIPSDAFEYLMREIDIQAHRDRRKSLKKVKNRLTNFIDKVDKIIKE